QPPPPAGAGGRGRSRARSRRSSPAPPDPQETESRRRSDLTALSTYSQIPLRSAVSDADGCVSDGAGRRVVQPMGRLGNTTFHSRHSLTVKRPASGTKTPEA